MVLSMPKTMFDEWNLYAVTLKVMSDDAAAVSVLDNIMFARIKI